jgi:hypothetical protein
MLKRTHESAQSYEEKSYPAMIGEVCDVGEAQQNRMAGIVYSENGPHPCGTIIANHGRPAAAIQWAKQDRAGSCPPRSRLGEQSLDIFVSH